MSQSRSVRRVNCAAPARRSAFATCCRRSATAFANAVRSWLVVETSLLRPLSGSTRVTRPTAGSSRSRGSRTSTASMSCRWDRARSGRSQSTGPMKSDNTTTSPRRRGGRRSCSIAAARSPRSDPSESVPARWRSAEIAASGQRAQHVLQVARPPRAGIRLVVAPVETRAPIRLPPPLVRCPTAAAAATTRSRFSQPVVPKSREPERSARSQVSSSRSAIVWRMCGCVVRAVTDQSIRRTSSPG